MLQALAREEAAKAQRDSARTELQELAERSTRDIQVLMDKEKIYKEERDALLRAIDKVSCRGRDAHWKFILFIKKATVTTDATSHLLRHSIFNATDSGPHRDYERAGSSPTRRGNTVRLAYCFAFPLQ